ncbi:MAG: glutamate 5-kinase [Acidobacteria bacterium RBG_16_64_8]|nr:MAG: glutamate 5-kinase [Acidobacteria bacterium RBG_16_64_8]
MQRVRRVVVKVGTSTLTAGGSRPSEESLWGITRQLTAAHRAGYDVTLVTSGAIATGAARLNFPPGPRSIRERQALAAVGQAMLMHEYERRFAASGIVVAQMLLTAGDFDQHQAYLNAGNTVEELLRHRVVPIVNENDTVATEEIRIGDNDTLSARVAALVNAELLCILSDVDGLYTADPHRHPTASRLDSVERLTEAVEALAKPPRRTALGVGGMITKLGAARIATAAGTAVAIVHGGTQDVVLRLLAGEELGTRFLPQPSPLRGRRRWIALRTRTRGRLVIDGGAADAIRSRGKSLLPRGVLGVEGRFIAGDVVAIVGPTGGELGRGVVSHGSEDLERVKGRASSDVRVILGVKATEVVHCDNLVIYS